MKYAGPFGPDRSAQSRTSRRADEQAGRKSASRESVPAEARVDFPDCGARDCDLGGAVRLEQKTVESQRNQATGLLLRRERAGRRNADPRPWPKSRGSRLRVDDPSQHNNQPSNPNVRDPHGIPPYERDAGTQNCEWSANAEPGTGNVELNEALFIAKQPPVVKRAAQAYD
jgi:hypothetical protein